VALDQVSLPSGYGLRPLTAAERAELADYEDHLLVWEVPRRPHRYVIGVDVSDGINQDRSVIDVTRVATIEEPDEQVAQFVSRQIDPVELAGYIDAIGRFYRDVDGFEALVAIEVNNHGLATQAELARHWGYQHFFVWQYEDKRNPANRYSTNIGWYTSAKTRGIILTRYRRAITAYDPITNQPDYRINSPFTMEELKDFQTESGLVHAAASAGATDDCIMAGAISVHVAQTLYLETGEPLSEARHRLTAERVRAERLAAHLRTHRDYINTDATVAEMEGRDDLVGWHGVGGYDA
jgi:hypothetical protein